MIERKNYSQIQLAAQIKRSINPLWYLRFTVYSPVGRPVRGITDIYSYVLPYSVRDQSAKTGIKLDLAFASLQLSRKRNHA